MGNLHEGGATRDFIEGNLAGVRQWASEFTDISKLPKAIIGGLGPAQLHDGTKSLQIYVISADGETPRPEGAGAVVGLYDFNDPGDWDDKDYAKFDPYIAAVKDELEKNKIKVSV